MLNMNRRGFLGAMLAAAAAPAIVRAGSLMPIYVPSQQLLTLWGDGVHDDTAALKALLAGATVHYGLGNLAAEGGRVALPAGAIIRLTDTLVLDEKSPSLYLSGTTVVSDEMLGKKPMMRFKKGGLAAIHSCHFKGNGESSAIMYTPG